jgi:hypothetical protein
VKNAASRLAGVTTIAIVPELLPRLERWLDELAPLDALGCSGLFRRATR